MYLKKFRNRLIIKILKDYQYKKLMVIQKNNYYKILEILFL